MKLLCRCAFVEDYTALFSWHLTAAPNVISSPNFLSRPIFPILNLNFVFCRLHKLKMFIKVHIPPNLTRRCHEHSSTMATKVKKGSRRLSRRKETLLKKAHEMGILCDVDVPVYLCYRKSGRLNTYKSINRQCWPPTEEQIVSDSEDCENHTNKAVETHLSDPISPTARGHRSEI